MGLPQVMVRLLHSNIGPEGRTVTVRVQVLLKKQHRSTACQVWEMIWSQPRFVMVLPMRLTTTLLQHGSVVEAGPWRAPVRSGRRSGREDGGLAPRGRMFRGGLLVSSLFGIEQAGGKQTLKGASHI